jgi:hypothetical protein
LVSGVIGVVSGWWRADSETGCGPVWPDLHRVVSPATAGTLAPVLGAASLLFGVWYALGALGTLPCAFSSTRAQAVTAGRVSALTKSSS